MSGPSDVPGRDDLRIGALRTEAPDYPHGGLACRIWKAQLVQSPVGLVPTNSRVGDVNALGVPALASAALLHMLGHGLAKGVLFLGAGRMLQVTSTTRIDRVRGLAAQQPVLAGSFGFGVLALLGLPPFSVFASELGIARAGFASPLGWATAAALLVVLVIAAALIGHTSRMLLGEPEPSLAGGPGTPSAPPPLPTTTALALTGGLLACAVLGVTAGPLTDLLALAAEIAGTP